MKTLQQENIDKIQTTHAKARYVNGKSSGEEHGTPVQKLIDYNQIRRIDNEQSTQALEVELNDLAVGSVGKKQETVGCDLYVNESSSDKNQETFDKMTNINEISGRSIGKNEITLLPREQFNGHIVVVDKIGTLDNALKCLNNAKFVGFDTETKPNFSKKQHHKVALMQLATDHTCYLLRLNRLGGIPLILENFLQNINVMKIGLSLVDDFNAIKKYTNIIPANFVDLQKIVPDFGIQDASLQKIYAILFGKKISKRARLSNWESDTLTENMQRYAALDAWACLKIYQQLVIRNNDK